ncbi:MAG: YraN family protein [Acutalibacteraceae bacterium]
MIGNEKGNMGEAFACGLLKSKGYNIVCRNYTSRYGEIDIIAEKDGYIVFVEVKARKIRSVVSPAEAVTPEKQKKIVKASLMYLQSSACGLQPRYDVIAVELAGNRVCGAKHYISAFDAQEMF